MDIPRRMTIGKITAKSNTASARPDSSHILDRSSSPGIPNNSSNEGSSNKLDSTVARKKNRSPSPNFTNNRSTNSNSPPPLEDPNIDLGQL